MRFGVMLAEIISSVLCAGLPKHMKLTLLGAVAYPIETHVDGFGSLLSNVVIDNTRGSGVVGLHRGWWLWVAEFFKGNTEWAGMLCVQKKGGKFGFSGTGQDGAHDLAEYVDGAVIGGSGISGCWRGRGVLAEEMVGGGA